MDRDMLLRELAKFFIEEFNNDPEGVADWVAQGPIDISFDDFHSAVMGAAKND